MIKIYTFYWLLDPHNVWLQNLSIPPPQKVFLDWTPLSPRNFQFSFALSLKKFDFWDPMGWVWIFSGICYFLLVPCIQKWYITKNAWAERKSVDQYFYNMAYDIYNLLFPLVLLAAVQMPHVRKAGKYLDCNSTESAGVGRMEKRHSTNMVKLTPKSASKNLLIQCLLVIKIRTWNVLEYKALTTSTDSRTVSVFYWLYLSKTCILYCQWLFWG